MAKRERVFKFKAVLEKMSGRFAWTYVIFPHDVFALFGKRGEVRVLGTVNGVPMDRALMPTGRGVHVLVLGQDLRKKAKVTAGDEARFEVWLNPKPHEIPLPDELRETLDFLPDFKQGWERMRPGMQRSICIWLNSAKTTATRAKRIAEVLRRFETGHEWFRVKGKSV